MAGPCVCLMQGIVNSKGKFVKDEIAKMYSQWIISQPFDMGGTTRNGLKELAEDPTTLSGEQL